MPDIEDMSVTCTIFNFGNFPKIAGGGKALKGLFSDSNSIFLWHESEDINKKSLFPKSRLIPILRFQVMNGFVCSIASVDYCHYCVE